MSNNKKIYYKLTHPQKRIWYVDKIYTNSAIHNIGGCLKINGVIDVELMKKVLNIIIQNNEGLRLRFLENETEPVQYLASFTKEEIDFLDFSNCDEPELEFAAWSNELFKHAFTLENNKLYYFAIYKLSEDKYGILLNIHHLISDGWSITLIQKQICEIYSNLLENEEVINREVYSYLDYLDYEKEYLSSERFKKDKEFWQAEFLDAPADFLYTTSHSTAGKRLNFDIESELSEKIMAYVKDKKCSLNTFFILILLIYINKMTDKKDIVIGTPLFNRSNKNQKNMIGMFTSTVPFRFKLDTEIGISELLKLVNKELKVCFLHQRYPYDLLVKDLELSKDGYDSLYKVCVNYYNSKYDNNLNGMDVEVEDYYCGEQGYSLQLTIKEWKEGKISLNFDYKTLEYSEREIQSMYEILLNITEQVISKDNFIVNDIKLACEKENNFKLFGMNCTTTDYPKKTVCQLFEEQVLKTPNKTALEFKDETLTYQELNEQANKLANYLRACKVDRTSIVAIMATHSIELMVSILGVLKAGAAYLPIDATYPKERINYMLQDSQSSILLTNLNDVNEVEFPGEIINIKELDLDNDSGDNLTKVNNLDDLVYIIYTSGSTGKPKGVMIKQQGLTNYIYWAQKTYLKDEDETMALYSSISFDLTVTSIFTPLISGHKIAIYDTDETEFILYKILRENKATVVKLTPAHLTLLKDMDNTKSKIKRFIVGGEDLKVSLAREVSNSFHKKIEIYNEYGPTETVVGCMIYQYDEEKDQGGSVPIGCPIDNVQVYILDEKLKPALTGFAGELYISGDGVAKGYLNRADLSRERFIDNPFIKGKVMYKTGDNARYLENGIIEYVGRIDKQVKIRGHRVELGEIEEYLLRNELVKEAVVVFKENSLGNKALNAYIVSNDDMSEFELKQWLAEFLPQYMIPAGFVFLKEIPLTLNGKVNYDLLPAYEAPKKKMVKGSLFSEKELVKAMKEVLGIKEISMDDNYYQLGGDSIKAIQISSKLKNVGLNVKVKDILAYDTLKEIADSIKEDTKSRSIKQVKSEGTILKTPITEWFFQEKLLNENSYNQYVLLECNEKLEIEKVKRAVNKLLEHHDALRINYDTELYYNNKNAKEIDAVQYFDFSKYDLAEQQKKIKELAVQVNSSFQLANTNLFATTLMKLDDKKQVLLFTAHHLIVDGVSWRIILDDFISILKQLDKGSELKLPLKTHSYQEWSAALKEYSQNDFTDEIEYWQSIEDKEMNFKLAANEEEDIVANTNVLSQEMDEERLSSLIEKANEIYNLELHEILIIGLVLIISNFTNNEEVIIELERHGRELINDYIDVSRTVGWFTSMYPAYFKVENDDLDNNIKSLKEQLRKIPKQGFNYSILKFLKKELKTETYKHIRFNYLGDFDNLIDKEKLGLKGIEFGLYSDKQNLLTAIMDINAMIIDKKLKVKIEYSSRRFKDETMQSFMESYFETMNLILDKCAHKDFKEFTPSDFDAVDISLEDLDIIFD